MVSNKKPAMVSLDVWVEDLKVGSLTQVGCGVSFQYTPNSEKRSAVSLEMPVRDAPYVQHFSMLPAFDVNIPEGRLLEEISVMAPGISSGGPRAFDMLQVIGRHQIGRVLVLPEGTLPERRSPVSDMNTLLHSPINSKFVKDAFDRYALRSGVSGAMPKILAEVRVNTNQASEAIQTKSVIIKFDAEDYAGLSLNEFHSMRAAQLAGNEVAKFHLSDDGHMLIVERFDDVDGQRLAFEDFCSLNGKTSDLKYDGSVESGLFKVARKHSGIYLKDNLKRLFRLIVTNVGLRNGDAHLKNFGLLYEDPSSGNARLAPAYDIVTTRAYLRTDLQALNMGGTKRWPNRAQLIDLGTRAGLDADEASRIIDEVGFGIQSAMMNMTTDLEDRGFGELAEAMCSEWLEGLTASLEVTPLSE